MIPMETDNDIFANEVERKLMRSTENETYRIVCQPTPTELELAVCQMMHGGWRCIGGASSPSGHMWVQAMVRYGN